MARQLQSLADRMLALELRVRALRQTEECLQAALKKRSLQLADLAEEMADRTEELRLCREMRNFWKATAERLEAELLTLRK